MDNNWVYYGFCALIGITLGVFANVLGLTGWDKIGFLLAFGIILTSLWAWAKRGKDIEQG